MEWCFNYGLNILRNTQDIRNRFIHRKNQRKRRLNYRRGIL
jgi:hypothetical protein